MEDFVLWQLDLKIALCGGERVAEAEVGNAVDERSEFQDDIAGGNLLVQRAGRNVGGDPGRDHDRIETEFFNAVPVQYRRKSKFGHSRSR